MIKSKEPKSEQITFRCTPTMRKQLKKMKAKHNLSVFDLLEQIINLKQ